MNPQTQIQPLSNQLQDIAPPSPSHLDAPTLTGVGDANSWAFGNESPNPPHETTFGPPPVAMGDMVPGWAHRPGTAGSEAIPAAQAPQPQQYQAPTSNLGEAAILGTPAATDRQVSAEPAWGQALAAEQQNAPAYAPTPATTSPDIAAAARDTSESAFWLNEADPNFEPPEFVDPDRMSVAALKKIRGAFTSVFTRRKSAPQGEPAGPQTRLA